MEDHWRTRGRRLSRWRKEGREGEGAGGKGGIGHSFSVRYLFKSEFGQEGQKVDIKREQREQQVEEGSVCQIQSEVE